MTLSLDIGPDSWWVVLLVGNGPGGELSYWGVVLGIVVLLGNIVGLYFYPVENCPRWGAVRPSFTVSRLSRRNFPGPATTQKVYKGIKWLSQLADLQWLTVLSMLIRGRTAGDWHILISCYVTLFWMKGQNTTSFRPVNTIGSFRSGNADVRLCVSCANFGSWHSYELETLRTPRIHNGSRQK